MGLMTALAIGGLVASSALKARSAKKAAKAQAKAVEDANRANVEAHTMTPEERAQYFAEGMTKVNEGFGTATEMTSRSLASRGLGGNALGSRLSEVGRGRGKAIGELLQSLNKTAMNMKASTPTIQPVPAVPSSGDMFLGGLGDVVGGVTGDYLGKRTADLFGSSLKKIKTS